MDSKILLHAILEQSYLQSYPDIHLNTGKRPYIRDTSWHLMELDTFVIDGVETKTPLLSKEDIYNMIGVLVWDDNLKKFLATLELDGSYNYENKDRYRLNCFVDTNGYSVALRIIPKEIPTLELLGLSEQVKTLCNKSKGLILVTGPTWAGKSTNLAAMINYINSNFQKHIITIEDPVEFHFDSKESLISQRELWTNTHSFSNAMKYVLREDPDVIMIWEMRDPETIRTAITLAETGHLVLSTLHTNDTVQTVDRIVDVFPPAQQDQVRMQLAMSLIGIVSQRLLPRADGKWRVPSREMLFCNDAVRNLIITGKTHQLYSVIEISQKEWMVLMDKYLLALYNRGLITKDTLVAHARDKEVLDIQE